MTLVDQLATYAAYHRDRRNLATHFIGIPMIVLSVFTLLSRPAVGFGGVSVSLAWLAAVATGAFYLRLDLRFGAAMVGIIVLSVLAGASLAARSTWLWLTVSVGLFVVGWVFQLVGHLFEGKKPAFLDDLIGLLVGPLFIVAEVAFALGARPAVHEEILRRAGPTRGKTPQLTIGSPPT